MVIIYMYRMVMIKDEEVVYGCEDYCQNSSDEACWNGSDKACRNGSDEAGGNRLLYLILPPDKILAVEIWTKRGE